MMDRSGGESSDENEDIMGDSFDSSTSSLGSIEENKKEYEEEEPLEEIKSTKLMQD